MTDIQSFEIGEDLSLAYRHRPGAGPTIIFLPGYASDMDGTKAVALDAWAGETGRAFLRFDYSGCGQSDGDFAAQGLADWRNDALAMIDDVAGGDVVLVGSSMGGWLMLLAALARPDRVKGLVGIAAAPDFTDWGFTMDQKMELLREGRIEQPSAYDDSVKVTTRVFWESGEALRVLKGAIVPIDCPARLLHGQADKDVPWTQSTEIARHLRSANVQTLLIKDGDHRLSRPQDIALLIAALDKLLEDL